MGALGWVTGHRLTLTVGCKSGKTAGGVEHVSD